MRLQGAEVMHLRAVGKVQRGLLRTCTLTDKTNFSTHARIIAAKCNGKQTHVAVALAHCNLMTNLPCVLAKFVNCQVSHARRLRSMNFNNRNNERMHVVSRCESLDHNNFAVLCRINHQTWVRNNAGLVNRMRDDHGLRVHFVFANLQGDDIWRVGVQLREYVWLYMHASSNKRGCSSTT